MAGNSAGARKRIATLRARGFDFKASASNAAKHNHKGGFASNKIDKNGLTGKQRASRAGKKMRKKYENKTVSD